MTTGVHLTTFPAPDRNIRRPQNQIDCPSIIQEGLADFATVFPTGPADHRGHTDSTQTAHKQHIGSTKGWTRAVCMLFVCCLYAVFTFSGPRWACSPIDPYRKERFFISIAIICYFRLDAFSKVEAFPFRSQPSFGEKHRENDSKQGFLHPFLPDLETFCTPFRVQAS